MAKNSNKIEKETRRLMEGISDVTKSKNGKIKFKTGSKKKIKNIKKSCVHWIFRNGKEVPTVKRHPEREGYWICTLCGSEFPIAPMQSHEYAEETNRLISHINQLQFWSVQMGGDAEDTKLFIQLKKMLTDYKKSSKNIIKTVNKREEVEAKRKATDDESNLQFYNIK